MRIALAIQGLYPIVASFEAVIGLADQISICYVCTVPYSRELARKIDAVSLWLIKSLLETYFYPIALM